MLLSVDIRELDVCVAKLQFAKGSDWEKCLMFPSGSAIEDFYSWADGVADNISVEAFFDIPARGISGVFAGFRVPAENFKAIKTIAEEFAASTGGYDLASFIKAADEGCGGEMFCAGPDFMELGVVNYWVSFGALRFWNGEGNAEMRLMSALDKNPRYLGRLPGIPAVESGYTAPVPHWVGVPVRLK
ncbi:MAG: hypothetical protein Q4F74_01460 [Synergistaceae bacterium]|nr:hypothetical protein [Synergistaceae bacterium]